MKHYLSLALSALLLLQAGRGAAQQFQAGAPSTDPKLTPGISGNSSIGNIYSPNLFNGTVNVGVPIYDYSNDFGSYGVSLSYNTKGVKVDEMASAVGLHWTLNGGGSITRVMKGLPDEGREFVPDSEYTTWGGTLFLGKLFNKLTGTTYRTYEDKESDDFIVSVPGLGFTFNMAQDGYKFSHPRTSSKIEILKDGVVVDTLLRDGDYTDFNFRITSPVGVVYHFIKSDAQRFDLMDRHPSEPDIIVSVHYISRWVLDKVVFPNGTEIKYNYRAAARSWTPLYKSWSALSDRPDINSGPVTPLDLDANTLEPTSIEYPNNVTVEFKYSTDLIPAYVRCDSRNDRFLRHVNVKSGSEEIMYRLNHVYSVAAKGATPATEIPVTNTTFSGCRFESGTGSVLDYDVYHRLILKSVDVCSGDGTGCEDFYTFEYNSEKLPPRLNNGQDWFGYYNGAISNSTLIPYTNVAGTDYPGVLRSSNLTSMKAQSLSKITNGYGGSINFGYSEHVLSNVLTGLPTDGAFKGNGAADGLRVSTITETDLYHPESSKITEFNYGGGQYFLTGGYFHFPESMSSTTGLISRYQFGGIYLSPHQFVNGANQGYTLVSATVRNEASEILSKKMIKFTNFKDGTASPKYTLKGGTKHYYQLPYSDKQYIRDWEIGLPLETTEYNSEDRMVSKITNTYSFTIDTASPRLKTNVRYTEVPAGSTRDFTSYVKSDSDSYRPYTGNALLIRSIMDKYVGDAIIVRDTISYTYDNKNNPLKTLVRNSAGEYTEAINIYNYAIAGPGITTGPAAGTPLYRMTQEGLQKQVGVERWKKGSAVANDQVIDASITRFAYDGDKLFIKGVYGLQSGAPVTRLGYTGTTSTTGYLHNKLKQASEGTTPTNFKVLSEVQFIDSRGNPLETKLGGQEQYIAMVWDTISGRRLAQANCRINDLAYSSFESGVAANTNISFPAPYIVHKSLVVGTAVGSVTGNYVCRLAGSQSISGNKSLASNKSYLLTFWAKSSSFTPRVYIGTTLLTLPAPSDIVNGWSYYSVPITPATAASFKIAAPSGIGSLFLDDVRLCPTDAQVTSSTFSNLFGETSTTDASGRVTYFEYDKMGRLAVVRDQYGHIINYTFYRPQ